MTMRGRQQSPGLTCANSPGGPEHEPLTLRRPDRWPTPAAARVSVLAAEDRHWVEGLAEGALNRERTCRELHSILLRAARIEVAQRCKAHHLGGADLDDIACQAASDALLLILRKVSEFRGDSKFTTWATRFVGFEVRAQLRQYRARHRKVGLVADDDSLLIEPNSDPHLYAEARQLAEAVRGVVNDRLSAHQRTVFLALLTRDASAVELGSELGMNANAIYQIAFRARRCLRGELQASGYLSDRTT
jgi:RNA polymerase sigma-70 factor (ECF subfamily)